MKKLWAMRHAFGMLLAFGFAGALLVKAILHYPIYAGLCILLLICWIIATQPSVRKEKERIKKLVDASFRESYACLPNPPSLKISSSYGYPAFEVVFKSKTDRDRASTNNDSFKHAIDEIYKGYGPRSRPFSADMAIFFTYDSYIDELRDKYKTA